ncbi:DUF1028 domain-containing protein [Paracoccus saliphilus]|uniref:DUF1028 domain-containing protein n=1 Tax=Paracoccus saliphilus TaxID=405559 RepID=A0AA46A722_9RHOB|nr:DUF1028 domain-containing protein [Paracoccus saliphilus]WCR03890.1 DUF1028 domain-containing protein [Paracoccus saliphilus]SIT06682.1 Uncharacterized conserved protein, Ntn-hydrolase superfamily [Paracoccus saliphilus]
MTFSLLVRDPETGTIGGAAATGSYCVGGWVLRGRFDSGLSASQGAAPSTFWGDEALDRMLAGAGAPETLEAVISADGNREWRQLTVLDLQGNTAAHSGDRNGSWHGHITRPGLVAAGNILAGPHVLERLEEAYRSTFSGMAEQLIAALHAAHEAGGDRRGLKSAALLVLAPDRPPMSLRIDMSPAPLDDLARLAAACQDRGVPGNYAHWTDAVPVPTDPFRADPDILSLE